MATSPLRQQQAWCAVPNCQNNLLTTASFLSNWWKSQEWSWNSICKTHWWLIAAIVFWLCFIYTATVTVQLNLYLWPPLLNGHFFVPADNHLFHALYSFDFYINLLTIATSLQWQQPKVCMSPAVKLTSRKWQFFERLMKKSRMVMKFDM